MTPASELRHVEHGPAPGDRPTGFALLKLLAISEGHSREVLARAKEVLAAVLANRGTTTLEGWNQVLPQWFVEACTPEQSHAEAERWLAWWRQLPPDEQAKARAERGWSLSNWLHWFEPEQRAWYWWDSRVLDADRVEVVVDAFDAPPPIGALEWLLKVAGAEHVEEANRTT